MSINQMTHSQKKWFSLVVAVALVTLFSMLTGCSSKTEADAKKKEEVTRQTMKQGDGKAVRKPGESGFKQF